MTLQGDLDAWPVTDVLRMVAATDKTGYLQLEAAERHGVVWYRKGTITAATTDRVREANLSEALSDVLRFRGGSFLFALDERAPTTDSGVAVEDLLIEAQALLDEWNDLQAEVPSLDCRLDLAERLPVTEVTISASLWPAVTAVAEGCTVAGFTAGLGLSELGALRVLHELTAAGLLRVCVPNQGPDAVSARLS